MDEISTTIKIGASIIALAAVADLYVTCDFSRERYTIIDNSDGKSAAMGEPIHPKRKFAVLVNATRHAQRHQNNIRLAYNTLEARAYNPNDVFVLEGRTAVNNYPQANNMPAFKETLQDVLSHLSKELTPDDSLFFYVTNHGHRIPLYDFGTQSTFQSANKFSFRRHKDSRVSEEELSDWMSGINANHVLMYFNQCFSGGFAHRLGKGNIVAISTTKPTKTSPDHANSNKELFGMRYSSLFTPYFFSAFAGVDPNGNSINADMDGDGSVSVMDAFIYGSKMLYQRSKALLKGFEPVPQLVYEKINPSNITL